MKVVMVIALVLGLSQSAEIRNRPLLPDILDFAAVIPIKDIMDVVQNHLQNDPEFGAGIKYLQSKEWNELIERLFATPEFHGVKEHFVSMGIPLEFLIKFGLNMIRHAKPVVVGDTIDFSSFIRDVNSKIPYDKVLAVANDKLQNNERFKDLFDKIASKDTYRLVQKLRATPEAKIIISQLTKMGIRMEDNINMVYLLMGWGSP